MQELKSEINEIDIIDIFEIIWFRKITIIGFTIISVLFVYIYQLTQPNIFTAVTEIRPISYAKFDEYKISNSQGIINLSQRSLLSMYIEQIEENNFLNLAIKKFNLLDDGDYKNIEEYNADIELLASNFEIIMPNSDNKSGFLKMKYYDHKKWKKVLKSLDVSANLAVQKLFITRFKSNLAIAYQERTNELIYLEEQAKIARKLGIDKRKKFSLENSQNTSITGAFFERGYIAIEAEIEIMEARDDLFRAESFFNETPLVKNDDFEAARILIDATEFEFDNKRNLALALTFVISSMISIFFVIIQNAMQKRK